MSHISIGQSNLMPYQRFLTSERFLGYVQYNKMSLKQIVHLILKDPSIIKFLQKEIDLISKTKSISQPNITTKSIITLSDIPSFKAD